jgi:pimeloyl-ACP methyl ester carboxylesterase/DNA-binding CsgD family transcriptional regulator
VSLIQDSSAAPSPSDGGITGPTRLISAIKQRITFCKARDGTRIAVATVGKGQPLLRTGPWFSHVEFDAGSPVWTPWLRELSRSNTYIRYDQRGCGLSDWAVPSPSFEARLSDLEAVVDTLGLKRFVLFGMSQDGALAIAYAARHPQRLSHLVLLGACASGALCRNGSAQQRDEAQILEKLIRIGWGRDNPAFRQVFTTMCIPEGTQEQQRWFNDLQQITTAREQAAEILETLHQVNVTHLAEAVLVPTLVLHARGDACVPFEEGRRLAALIPAARFVPLDSRNHVLLETEPAWVRFLTELRAFFADGQGAAAGFSGLAELTRLTPSEHQVLGLLARGFDNATIAGQLGKRPKTVRNQVSSILSKLEARSRAEAIVVARDAGIGAPSV